MEEEVCQRGFRAPKSVLHTLHDNQAQDSRHQCPICSYNAGIQEGIRRASEVLQSLANTTAGR
jgi:hypothetical protein